MRLANVALVDGAGVRLVRNDLTYAIQRATCIRLEPAFVFGECLLTINFIRAADHRKIMQTRRLTRDSIALFEEIPELVPEKYIIDMRIDAVPATYFCIDVRCRIPSLVCAAWAGTVQSRFYRDRYLTQSLPFQTMLACTREELDRVAARLVFVVGSVGKTTTKELLSFVLKEDVDLIHSTDSWNFPHEICSQIRNNVFWCRLFVMEAALGGHLRIMGKLLPPDVFIFTAVGVAHTAFSQDLHLIAREKATLAAHMRAGSVIIANMSDEYIRPAIENLKNVQRGDVRVISVSTVTQRRYDITATLCDEGIAIRDNTRSTELVIKPRSNVSLAEGVAACAYAGWRELGSEEQDLLEFKTCISTFVGVPGRLEIVKLGRITVLNDAYNSNPASMRRFLARLTDEKGKGYRILAVLGEMLDLGPLADVEHARIAEEACRIADKVIFLGERYGHMQSVRNAEWVSSEYINLFLSERIHLEVDDFDFVAFKGSHATGLLKLAHQFIARTKETMG
jgi:UDP-N-acetylmuramoyl-tripeptide--D-alanyl-D-alanine ligase